MKYLIKPIAAIAALAFAITVAHAVTPADKAALQANTAAAKALIDALPLDGPPPAPPTAPWPRVQPDVLEIDFVNVTSILGAKMLDGSPGYDGTGKAIHYGSMSGAVSVVNNANGTQTVDYSAKLSNPLCPPKWGMEPSGLKYLETCTNNSIGEVYNASTCATCRLIWWNFQNLKPAQEYYFRYMIYLPAATLANQTDLGIKLAGLMGQQIELGDVSRQVPRDGWPLQTYRYDAETVGYGTVEPMNFKILPDRWYTIEEHIRVNTLSGGVYQKDGVVEVKVDGVRVWGRSDMKIVGSGVPQITNLLVQFYHGGLRPPKGPLIARIARLAICSKSWCGPAAEVSAP